MSEIIQGMQYTLITGPGACGKSTLAKLLNELANSDNVLHADTSDIIRWHMGKKTQIGLKLLEYRENQQNGELMPDGHVFEAITDWSSGMRKVRNFYHLILAGSPRSWKQGEMWKKFSKRIRVIHIQTDQAQTAVNILKRQKATGIIRPDENLDAVNNRHSEYMEKVLPGLGIWNGELLHIPGGIPMREKLDRAIKHMDVPDNVRERWLHRLSTRDHPVSKQVDVLDGLS